MRKGLTFIMVCVAIVLAAGVGFLYMSKDRVGPEIFFTSAKATEITSDMTEEELLEGVEAEDAVDGDVSSSLKIEAAYSKNEGQEVSVIYVAKDNSNNVTKTEYTMTVAGYATTGDADGYSSEDYGNLTLEEQARLTQEAKIDELSDEAPRIYLTDYYLELPLSADFDSLSYVADVQDDLDDADSLWRSVQVDGVVNTYMTGTYTLSYYVTDTSGNVSNIAELTVVVVESVSQDSSLSADTTE